MTALGASALVLVLLAATPQDLEQARQAFEAGYFDEALKALDRLAFAEKDDAARAQIDLLRAQCFAAQQRPEEVDAALLLALRSDPESALDRERVLPELVERLESLRRSLHGQLTVQSDTPVSVFVDGHPAGDTPLSAQFPIGRHRLEATVAGQRVIREVVLRADAAETVTLDPAPEVEPPSAARFELALQANLDPSAGVGGEIGIGFGSRRWAVSARSLLGGAFGIGVRGCARRELWGRLSGYLAGDATLFLTAPAVPALGATGGMRLELNGLFSPFVEAGPRWAARSDRFRNAYLVMSAGIEVGFP